MQPGYWFANVSQSISVTYANTYGRFSVLDHLCSYSFAANGGVPGGPPVPLAAATEAQIFGTSNGIPPTSGVALINNAAPGGPKEDRGSTPSQNLDGALCLRSLATGRDAVTGAPLIGAPQRPGAPHRRWRRGHPGDRRPAPRAGDLRDRPQRRHPAAEPHLARLFRVEQRGRGLDQLAALLRGDERAALDSFNQFPGYNDKYIPLHRYFNQAMDLMYAHLRQGRPLPPSQVVHTIPRGPGAPPITAANVPPIAASPPSSALITFSGGQVRIPN